MTDQEIEKLAEDIHMAAYDLFDYTSDKRNYMVNEHWKSHADSVRAGETFKDDCDGFALTCAELLIEDGVDPSKISIIYCIVKSGREETGHLVTGVQLEEDTIILDNRFKQTYSWAMRSRSVRGEKYIWKYFMPFDDKGNWYKIANS